MTPATIPSKLYRPLAEVKSYVEKMPDGVTLTKLSNKVGVFGSLTKKEKTTLIDFLEQRESILVIQAKPLNGKNLMTFLRHKKFGYPNTIPGYVYPVKKQQAATIPEPIERQEKIMETLSIPTSPEALRKQAERLLKAAEEAEKKRNETDFMNKQLAPIKLEICQAAGKMQRKLDEFIDCMDEMNKAIQKFKDLSA
ncbi:hypothetical protein [Intestinirhabdus alba]|jgi:hypothetical protein|uniref:Uncharacterized protein n=1 Tax=Intestinirhabdus alba TaxID=2899544 RepID=A0A6L6IIG7_9ENTR|nr:hypothetical protein [Intestinirhabdus alba]MTH45386.1 hypothetical protein [Intestinirhabdus alba]